MYDKDIRRALHLKSLKKYHEDPNSCVWDEVNICDKVSRIDIMILSDSLCGIEIKSDRDTLQRLSRQITFYGFIFQKMKIVCTDKFLEEISRLVPEWWGIEKAEETETGITFQVVREEKTNPNSMPHYAVNLLWRTEIVSILEDIGKSKGFKSKAKGVLVHKLINEVGPIKARELAVHRLKKRERTVFKE